MSRCSITECKEAAVSMCICDIGIERYCEFHRNTHRSEYPNHELHPLSPDLDQNSIQYLLEILDFNKHKLLDSINSGENQVKYLENWIKRTNSTLDELRNFVDLTEQMIKQLIMKTSSLGEFALNNFECFLRIHKTSVEKFFKVIYSSHDFVHLNKFETVSFYPYFRILEKISKPILITQNPLIQSDFSAYFKQNSEFRSTFFHACYRNENVTVKRVVDASAVENDLQNHEEAMKTHPEMLRIYSRYKDNGKHIIITEPWTHTLWNEIQSRKFEDCKFDELFIVRILKDLLKVFKDEKKFLHFTPNVLHMISQSDYKIWYPQEINIYPSITETTYLSPDLENYPNSIQNENLTPAIHNIFSLGLVVLQIATLVDTSQLYKEQKKKEAEELVMKMGDTQLRTVLIGMLLRIQKIRFTFEKALEGLGS